MDENLASNFMFVLDAIIDGDGEEPDEATMDVALALTHFAWNSEIQADSCAAAEYKTVLRKAEDANPQLWEQLIRRSSEELITILKQRKMIFFPEDRRLIRGCFRNMLGGITVEEANSEGTQHMCDC